MKRNARKLKNHMKEKILYESLEHRVVFACGVTGLKFSCNPVMKNKRNTLRRPFHEYNVLGGEQFISTENENTGGDHNVFYV